MGTSAHATSAAAEISFATLYRQHHRAVLAYCARRASPADAWDAASEVFVVAWRRLNDVPAVEHARPWLYGVAFRVLANQRRSTHRRIRLNPDTFRLRPHDRIFPMRFVPDRHDVDAEFVPGGDTGPELGRPLVGEPVPHSERKFSEVG